MPQVRQLIVEPEAENDVAEGMSWYEEQQPGLGAALLAEVDEALQGIERGDAVVFLEHAGRVHAIAVAHFKRRPGYWSSRLRAFGGDVR